MRGKLRRNDNLTSEKTLFKQTLSNLRQIILCSNATPIRRSIGRKYLCSFCTERFPSPAELKEHNLNEHFKDLATKERKVIDEIVKCIPRTGKSKTSIKLDITSFTCTLCGSPINDIAELYKHLKSTHNGLLHTDIKNLMIQFKFDSDQLSCYVCSKEFSAFSCLVEHMNTHVTNYKCNECPSAFVVWDRLKDHQKKTHNVGSFKCTLCLKVFKTKTKLYLHGRNVHKKGETKCNHCGEAFPTRWEKQKHELKQHDVSVAIFKKVKCDACEREFNNVGSYNAHFRRFHLMERSHKCDRCDMTFFESRDLKRHLVKHGEEKKFVCDFCSKAFKWKRILREHLRIHTDDRRFKCKRCGLGFVQKITWRGHMRTKHGEMV
ncbi:unnamed protein product [Leptosia nina]|uniref:C2H2-type domain-containing protein n=1 Tax=Leptosia nina TaxID=320188 RepID=A0AAV1K1X2_9NEOP